MWRATVLTLFPEMFPGPLGVKPCGQGAGVRAVGAGGAGYPRLGHRPPSQRRRHPGRRRTRHGAARGRAGRGDRCGRHRPGPAAPADEPARSAIDPVAGDGTRGRAGAADRLRPVRGHRPAGHRSPQARGSLGRGLCAVRRRNRRHGAAGRLRPAAAGRDGKARIRVGRELFRRTTGIPAIYPPAGVRGPADPGNPDLRRSRPGRGLAAGRGRGPDQGPAAGFVGGKGPPKTPKKRKNRTLDG